MNLLETFKTIQEEKEIDATPKHVHDEAELFKQAVDCLNKIHTMALERLKGDLTSEHVDQYTNIETLTKQLKDVLEEHVASYE